MTFCFVFSGAAARMHPGRSSKVRVRASWIFLWRVRGDSLEGCSRSLSPRLMGQLARMAKHLLKTSAAPPLPPALELMPAQRAVFAMVSLLLRIERESQGRVRVCRNVNDIQEAMEDGLLAPVMHIEGAEAIDPNFEVLDVLYRRAKPPSSANAAKHGRSARLRTAPADRS